MLCTVGAMVGVMSPPCWNHVGPCKDTVEEQFDKIERQKESVQHRRVQNSAHSTAGSEPPAVHCLCAMMGARSPQHGKVVTPQPAVLTTKFYNMVH